MKNYQYAVSAVVILCFLYAAGLTVSLTEIGKDWNIVKRGSSAYPIEFTREGLILYHQGDCRLEVAREDETTTDIRFSALSPDGEYRIVIGDVYDAEPAYLLRVNKCALMHLPLPRYFQPWVSWSPGGKHALFYTNYEASPQLWLSDPDTGQVLEVHRTRLAPRADTCCGLNEWAPKSGVGYLVPESVHWNDAGNFAFRLEIFCNPYSEGGGWPCENGDIDHARAAYEISVNLDSSKVTTGSIRRFPARKSPTKN
jgi:hypothetical protein